MNYLDLILAFLANLPIFATLVLGSFLARNGKSSMGKPTINPMFFYSGKFLLFFVWAFFAFVCIFPEYQNITPLLIVAQITELQKIIAIVLLIPANLIIVPAYLNMGLITNIGLPVGKHELKTKGIYGYSRNPMYSSFFFLNSAVFFVIPDVLLAIIMIYGMVVHHFIILGEEAFLESSFGEQFIEYKKKVPRYI